MEYKEPSERNIAAETRLQAKSKAESCFAGLKVNVVTLLDPAQFGGLEAYTRNLLSGLTDAGVEVDLNGRKSDSFVELADVWHRRSNRLLPLMTRKPLRHLAVAMANCWGRSWASVMVDEYDIQHFIGTGWDLLGFPLLSAAVRKGKVFTCLPAIHPGTWGDAPLDIDLYRRSSSVLCLSGFEAQHLERLGVTSQRVVVVPCGPEKLQDPDAVGSLKAASFRDAHGLGDRPMVLFIGRKSRTKGYQNLQWAIQILAERGSDVILVAIGKDIDSPIPNLPHESFCDLGPIGDDIKQAALAACDVFALPSEAESFGIVYVEAWRYAKPVLCGTAPASRELISKHRGGVITDGTATDIANALSELLGDKQQQRELGLNGFCAWQKLFTPDAVARAHLNVWNQIVCNQYKSLRQNGKATAS